MKMSIELYNSIKKDMKTIMDTLGFEKCQDRVTAENKKRCMWQLLNKLILDRSQNNDHPQFIRYPDCRILPFDGRKSNFCYDEGLNDSHIETALLKISKELLNI